MDGMVIIQAQNIFILYVSIYWELVGIKVRLLASKDLDAAADLGLDCFFVPRFQVNDNGLNSWERSILCSVASGLTAVEKGDAWLSNKFGFYNRAGKRLKNHNWLASDDSLIIVAVTSNITNTNVDQEKLVGLIELCLDKPNGLLSPPFRPVDFFGLLPTGKVNKGSTYAPYLCNLSVAKEFRRKGLGKMLCQVSERVAKDMWGYKDMYLHVQEENVAAQKLYESMGYVRKNVLTKRQIEDEDMEKIRYYWKDLNATDSRVDQITPIMNESVNE